MDIRCPHKMHGTVDVEENLLEVRCKSRLCGAAPGVVVIHKFNLLTGSLEGTDKFQATISTGGNPSGSSSQSSSIRSA